MPRTIGIRHRVKQTAKGEARPTQVCIVEGEKVTLLDLGDEQAELDFASGIFPTAHRNVEEREDLTKVKRHHIKWRKLTSVDQAHGLPDSHVRQDGRTYYRAHQIPSTYDGLKAHDRVAMVLGGSGDSLAYALTRRGKSIDASVYRIPPSKLSIARGEGNKDDDADLLARLLEETPEFFYSSDNRDLALITVRELYRARMDAMKARIACEQRLRQLVIGETFRSDIYPEGDVEHAFDLRKANDIVLQNLEREEAARDRQLAKALEGLDIYQQLFKQVEGLGPSAAARILSAIVDYRQFIVGPDEAEMQRLYEESERLEKEGNFEADIGRIEDKLTKGDKKFRTLQLVRSYKRRIGKGSEAALLDQAIACHKTRAQMRHKARQKTAAKLKAFCGVHVLEDGRFARKRSGQVANWNPDARQGLYLLADQWSIYRPNSPWGVYLNQMKANLRQKHPAVETVEGKKRYTDGHIFKMARWRTLTRFVEQMAYAFCDFDKGKSVQGIRPPKSQVD